LKAANTYHEKKTFTQYCNVNVQRSKRSAEVAVQKLPNKTPVLYSLDARSNLQLQRAWVIILESNDFILGMVGAAAQAVPQVLVFEKVTRHVFCLLAMPMRA